MKILPIIAISLISLIGFMPFAAAFLGLGVPNKPNLASTIKDQCQVGQKDKYGRCPYSGSSGFRAFSTSGSSGTGSFGGTK